MARSKARRTAGAPVLRRTVADLRALAHPLRLRMMELFAESPKTTKQVADILHQPPTRLYHHVAALERAGLLVLKETRQNRGAVEKWYVGVTQQMHGPGRGPDSATRRKARRALAATALEQAKQELMAIPAGAKEPALVTRVVFVVSPSKVPEIRHRLFDAVQEIGRAFRVEGEAGSAADDCTRWALTLSFAPASAPKPSSGRR
jgi:DNA-binding transcriptional ArsR family regulator